MIILGIDPGIAIVGYGVINSERGNHTVVDYGVITTPKELTTPLRLKMIADGLDKLIDKYHPDAVSIEELFFATNAKTAIIVAEARGVILLTVINKCGKLYEYTPLQIKQAITGYGRADKPQMQSMVKMLLHLQQIPKPDDAADALAVALTHAQSSKMGNLFSIK